MKIILRIIFLLIPLSIWGQKTELVLPAAHAKHLKDAVFSLDKKLLLTSGDDEVVKIWDAASQRLLKTIEQQASEIKLSPDGKMAALIGVSAINMLNLADFTISTTIKPDNRGIFWSAVFSPNSQQLYIGGAGYHQALLWSYNVGEQTLNLVHDIKDEEDYSIGFRKIFLTADGNTLIGTGLKKIGTQIINTKTWKPTNTISPDMRVKAITPQGDILVTLNKESGENPALKFLDGKTLAVKHSFTVEQRYKHRYLNGIMPSHKGDAFLITDGNEIWQYKVATKSVEKIYEHESGLSIRFENVFWSRDDKKFIVGSPAPTLHPLSKNTDNTILTFGKPIMNLDNLAASPVKSMILVGSTINTKKFLDLSAGNFEMHSLKLSGDADFSADGKLLASATDSYKKVGLVTMPDFEEKTIDLTHNFGINSTLIAPNGRYLATVSTDKVSLVDIKNGKLLFETPVQGKYSLPMKRKVGVFSPDSKHFVYLMEPQHPTETGSTSEPTVYCIASETGALIWKKNYHASGFRYAPDGKTLHAYNERDYKIMSIEATKGDVTASWGLVSSSQSYSFVISQDASVALTDTEKDAIDVYDIAKKELLFSMEGHTKPIKRITFLKNKRYAASIGEDNFIRFYDLELKKQVAKMVLFENTNDWAVFSPDGRFDASSDALKTMYYMRGKEIISFESLYEKFYTPKLLQSLLEGVDIGPAPINIEDVKLPPSVKIGVPSNQRNLTVEDDDTRRMYNMPTDKILIKVDAKSIDDAIAEIRLYHNGKLVGSGTRNLVVEDDTKIEKSKSQSFDIQLVAGENVFKAIAINTQRTESKPDEIIVNYKAASTSNAPNTEGGITLHLMVIGINKYKNPKYNLNYATADATSFKEAIEKGGSTIFSKTNMIFIGDDKATKEGISAELEKIKTAANPKDVLIFYYAGHGVLNEKKEFYLVPHDVTQLYGNDDALAQKGLSANQLQQFSKEIKAQKQLFILDACQSAGALEAMAMRGAAEEKAIAQLARATGTHWLTASGSEQFASEFAQLGHGTFTYVLLEALSGKADKGGDKKITVKELDAYLQEQVPEVTAKYKGTPQYPASYGFGNDFPIGVVKN